MHKTMHAGSISVPPNNGVLLECTANTPAMNALILAVLEFMVVQVAQYLKVKTNGRNNPFKLYSSKLE